MKSAKIFQSADFIKRIKSFSRFFLSANIKSLHEGMAGIEAKSDAIASHFIVNEFQIFKWTTHAAALPCCVFECDNYFAASGILQNLLQSFCNIQHCLFF